MVLTTVNLTTINDIKEFTSIALKHNLDVVVRQGKFSIDGKSIMGLFSLDLTRSILVELDVECEEMENFLKKHEIGHLLWNDVRVTYK